ncbi:hypothetical protein OG840_33860 [Streptomyces sp. NBC_01764]|uniref:hypothetical protein n=1 Tax=Streptomyces sp. NBC_01764 TaxID=2975935 RepID=UPI002250653C|nr:hypothetical protein [Streptomyces sp. NBC_01764]MCX4406443.1 hypothetical protein [Streptomyces sp. NBC_01764]
MMSALPNDSRYEAHRPTAPAAVFRVSARRMMPSVTPSMFGGVALGDRTGLGQLFRVGLGGDVGLLGIVIAHRGSEGLNFGGVLLGRSDSLDLLRADVVDRGASSLSLTRSSVVTVLLRDIASKALTAPSRRASSSSSLRAVMSSGSENSSMGSVSKRSILETRPKTSGRL